MNLNGIQKCIALLLSMDIKKSLKVLKKLNLKEIDHLVLYSLSMHYMEYEKLKKIFVQYKFLFDTFFDFNKEKKDFYLNKLKKKMLTKNLLKSYQEIEYDIRFKKNITSLNEMNINVLFNLIKNEPLKIVSIILVKLHRAIAAEILLLFPTSKQSDIIIHITEYNSLSINLNKEFNEIVECLLEYHQSYLLKQKGLNIVLEILKIIKLKNNKISLINIEKKNEELSKKLMINLITFDDFFVLQKKHINKIIDLLTIEDLYISLYNQKQDYKNYIMQFLTKHQYSVFQDFFYKKNVYTPQLIKEKQNLFVTCMKNMIISNEIKIIELEKNHEGYL
ncbi:FliG C-terminal domain-containing protein [Buchnera aphidicola]|nr:FliG C-terminal domain-containing protein [Buchnera aphidicola]